MQQEEEEVREEKGDTEKENMVTVMETKLW